MILSTVVLLSSGLTATLDVSFSIVFALGFFFRDLPAYRQLATYEPPIVSCVYAAYGLLVGEFASDKRILIPYGSGQQGEASPRCLPSGTIMSTLNAVCSGDYLVASPPSALPRMNF